MQNDNERSETFTLTDNDLDAVVGGQVCAYLACPSGAVVSANVGCGTNAEVYSAFWNAAHGR